MKKLFFVLLPCFFLIPSCQKVISSPGFNGVVVDSLSGTPVSGVQVHGIELINRKKDTIVLLAESGENGEFYVEQETKRKLFPLVYKVPSIRTMVLRHRSFKEKLVTGFVSDIRLTDSISGVDTVYLQKLPGH